MNWQDILFQPPAPPTGPAAVSQPVYQDPLLPPLPTVAYQQPVEPDPRQVNMATQLARDIAYGHSDWQRSGQAILGSGKFEDASAARRVGAAAGGAALGSLALLSWIPGFNVFKPAQAARAARAFGQGAAAGGRAGTGVLRGGWDEAAELEKGRRAAKAAEKAGRVGGEPAVLTPSPIVETYRPILGDSSRGNLELGRPWEPKVFPIEPEDWARGLYRKSLPVFDNLKAIQGGESIAVNSALLKSNRAAYNLITGNLDDSGKAVFSNPKSFEDLVSQGLARVDEFGAAEISVPRSRSMYSGAFPEPWDGDGVSYVISLKGSPQVVGARALQGRYVVPEVGSDFLDSSFFPNVGDSFDGRISTALTPNRINRITDVQQFKLAAHIDIMESLSPHLARNPDNVLYYTQAPDHAMGWLSAGTMTNSIEEAFDVAARRGRAYITDPSTGRKIRVPDEIANAYRGDLGPVAPNRFEDVDFISNLKNNFSDPDNVFWGSRGTGDEALAAIYKAQGFDALPRVVSVDEMERLHRAGFTPIYRGITDVLPSAGEGSLSSTRPESSLTWARQLLYGNEHYAAAGSVGSGTYFTPAFARASNYTEAQGVVVAGAIDPRARMMGPGEYHNSIQRMNYITRRLEEGFMRYDEALRWQSGSASSDFFPPPRSLKENFEIAQTILAKEGLVDDPVAAAAVASFRRVGDSGQANLIFSDPGRFAALMGYDGYLAPSTVYGYAKPEYVMLNRKAIIFADTAVEVSENGRTYTQTRLTP